MRPATKPLAVILQAVGCYYPTILYPDKPFEFTKGDYCLGNWCKGPLQALGVLVDDGYRFNQYRRNIPTWVISKVPSQYEVHSVANIISFPKPK